MPSVHELYDEAEKLKEQGEHDNAIAKLQTLLEQDDRFVLAHLALAVLYGKTGRHEDAVRHGRTACDLEPDDPFNFIAMSVTCRRAFQGTGDPQYLHLAEDAMMRQQRL